MRGLGIAVLLMLASVARQCRGQTLTPTTAGSVDLGAAFLQQPGLTATNVLTAASQLAYTAARYSLAANGVLAVTPQDRFTGQSVLTGSLYAPSARRFRWEL
ncbi:MAG TPA: hypothetical protein VJW73_00270, partial [Gemmatimonadaceae bacterium]|nr:hypothetical protein [Gemmatimonadaceae bacterium]